MEVTADQASGKHGWPGNAASPAQVRSPQNDIGRLELIHRNLFIRD